MTQEALLIVDMSNDFVHDEGGLTAGKAAQEIVPMIVQKANEFLQAGKVVAICMDAHEPNDTHFELWPKHNVKGTWGQKLYGPLEVWYQENKEHLNVLYIPKPEYDAFFETNLHDQLQEKGVARVHVTGVCTDICDFLTVYGAYARGYETVVYSKGTATFTNQHDLFLKHMEAIFKTKIV
ncbi:cysteine hydrolase [Pullulanibacillus sp. KACC 23026]|uniref:cysteine hydrolase family protein n=1 Tax=Pullulanibacillus sp. KACC 23026 TaxID=3028315 RepID=UPI0023B13210|nr:isochorismatase family cysteine hydrolase [Pullulanibacillus sp. KACC 23026]WEG14813.1 cysteine hydrolase [Pullulanibacillus sp. KACC 23026]